MAYVKRWPSRRRINSASTRCGRSSCLSGTLDEEALRKHCQAKLAQTHVPVRFIGVAEMPRNGNGKLDRQRLGEMVQGIVRIGAVIAGALLLWRFT